MSTFKLTISNMWSHAKSRFHGAYKVFSANLSDEPKLEILACRNVPTISPCIRFRILLFQLYYLTVCSKYFYVHVSDDPTFMGSVSVSVERLGKGEMESRICCAEKRQRREEARALTHTREKFRLSADSG